MCVCCCCCCSSQKITSEGERERKATNSCPPLVFTFVCPVFLFTPHPIIQCVLLLYWPLFTNAFLLTRLFYSTLFWIVVVRAKTKPNSLPFEVPFEIYNFLQLFSYSFFWKMIAAFLYLENSFDIITNAIFDVEQKEKKR